jgi:hypothetical protein
MKTFVIAKPVLVAHYSGIFSGNRMVCEEIQWDVVIFKNNFIHLMKISLTFQL